MKKIMKNILVLCLFPLILSSCTLEKNNNNYVDLDNAEQRIEENRLNIQTQNFVYDDKPYNIMKLNDTIDAEYYYSFKLPNMKINLQNGRIQNICQIPGCAHTYDSHNCIGNQDFNSPIATTDGIYYIQDNQVMLYRDNSEEVILKNNYYTDYEKETYPDNMSVISALTIYNDTLYVVCPTYFLTYDMQTKKITEPKKLCDSFCMSLAATEDHIYYSTDSLELYQYDLNTNSAEKIDDKVGQVSADKGQIYYIKYEDEVPVLYVLDDEKNTQRLIEDCWVNYYIKGDHIYYQSFYENKNLYVSKLNGNDKIQINLEYNGEYLSDLVKIISTDALEHVFIVDDIQNVIFVFEADSAEYKVIAIEEE